MISQNKMLWIWVAGAAAVGRENLLYYGKSLCLDSHFPKLFLRDRATERGICEAGSFPPPIHLNFNCSPGGPKGFFAGNEFFVH